MIGRVSANIHRGIAQIFANLSINDLLESERHLQKCILEYDQITLELYTPLLIVRRCGGVLKVNSAFSKLIKIPLDELIASYYFYELVTEETMVNYYEKITDLFREPAQKAVIMNCMLVEGGDAWRPMAALTLSSRARPLREASAEFTAHCSGKIPCVMTIRIKKDNFGIPMFVSMSIIPMISI